RAHIISRRARLRAVMGPGSSIAQGRQPLSDMPEDTRPRRTDEMIVHGHALAHHSRRIGLAALALALVAACTAPAEYQQKTATAETLRQARQQLLADLQ